MNTKTRIRYTRRTRTARLDHGAARRLLVLTAGHKWFSRHCATRPTARSHRAPHTGPPLPESGHHKSPPARESEQLPQASNYAAVSEHIASRSTINLRFVSKERVSDCRLEWTPTSFSAVTMEARKRASAAVPIPVRSYSADLKTRVSDARFAGPGTRSAQSAR